MVNKKVIRFTQKLTTPVSNKCSNLCSDIPLGTYLLEIDILTLDLPVEIERFQRYQPFHESSPEISQRQVVDVNQDERNLLWGQGGNPTDRDDQRDRLRQVDQCRPIPRYQLIQITRYIQINSSQVWVSREQEVDNQKDKKLVPIQKKQSGLFEPSLPQDPQLLRFG